MLTWKHVVSAVGARRAIGVLGGVYVALALGRGLLGIAGGVPAVNVLVITLLVGVPGAILVYGAYRLPRSDVDPAFYPNVAGWCLAGFAVMGGLLVVYHLLPGLSVSTRAPPILTALASLAGFAVGHQDGQARTRSHELEETVDRLEASNQELERYRGYTDDVLDAIHDIFYVLDDGGTLRRWNESVPAVTGYSDAEVASMHALDFFDEDDHERIAAAIAEGFDAGSVQVEAEIRTKDGAFVPYEFAATTLADPDGETVLAGIGRDVSERRARERALATRARQQQVVAELGQIALETDDLDELMAEAARLVRDTLDTAFCQVLELDGDGDLLLLRQGVGWDEGMVGEASEPADAEASQAAYTLAHDRPIVVEDLRSETRFDGPELLTSHDVRSGISTVVGPFDEPWGILGTHDTEVREFSDEDVTFVQSVANVLAEAIERHQYQADLEASNERLEQFAYAASHDLQEPLRMVSSYLQLIERRYGDELDEDAEEFLAFAVDGAERMRSMIQGLLQYSRVETQGAPFEPVDLEAVLADVRADLQVSIEASDATITADPLPRVHGDPDQIRQVLQNLLDNAIEYSGDEPPSVHVSARRNGAAWTVSVRDEGIGIEPGDRDRIFEVFQRASAPGDGGGTGTGIGLALCERIVERHGGDIWVDSDPGGGTTFSFTLPAADDAVE